jgi:polyhydroxyalkanoate synthesis regulator phasin
MVHTRNLVKFFENLRGPRIIKAEVSFRFTTGTPQIPHLFFTEPIAMIELLKRTVATGLGLAVMTRDKVEELGKELIKTAKLSEQEGNDFLQDLHTQAETSQKELSERIDKEITKVVERLNLATRDEVNALRAEVAELKASSKDVNTNH